MGLPKCMELVCQHPSISLGFSAFKQPQTSSPRLDLGGDDPKAPTLCKGSTRNAPPPLASTMMATNRGLTAQKELSQVTRETRMSS